MTISIELLLQSKLIQIYVKLLVTMMHVEEERKLVSTKHSKVKLGKFTMMSQPLRLVL